MNHGLMQGMFWAGLLLVAVPVALGAGIAVALLRRHRSGAARGPAGGPADPA